MTAHDNDEADSRQLFDRFLEGRRPRPFSEFQSGLDLATPRRDAHRRRRHWVTAAAVAAVGAAVVVGGYSAVHGDGHRTASLASGPGESTTSTSAPDHRTIPCGPDISPATDGPQAIVMGSENQAALETHFGNRLNSIWTGNSLPELGDDQRVMVAATHITDADRAFARTIPVHGGHIQLVDARYSEDDLKAFAARLKTVIPDWKLPARYVPPTWNELVATITDPTTTIPIPDSVWPKGLVNVSALFPRSDGSDLDGENLVGIFVRKCSPGLVAQAVRIADAKHVPLDAIRIHATHWGSQ